MGGDKMENKKTEDFNKWFQELIKETELVDDRYNVKGFLVYREWCAMTLNKMYQMYEDALQKKAHYPLYMPVVIPEQNFYKEAEHVEGFTPEVFWVTSHGKDEKLEEKLALRPTSETAFYQMYALWIRSHNDLPYKRYQAGSVYRYETKATKPFMRGREFYWIETHCAFKNEEDARNQVLQDMETTNEVMFEKFGVPFIFFRRPEWDKFAGAVDTYGADALIPNGKVLQLPSTHYLGLNFSKAFNVKYTDNKKEEQYCHLTCYGPAITRIYGGMIAVHSDDKGLRLPFELAPVQVIIIPIVFAGKDNEKVLEFASKIEKQLCNDYIVAMDRNTEKTPGEKYYYWEMKGVPIRIEVGPKDLEKNAAMIFRRDLNTKESVPVKDLDKYLVKIQSEFTENLKKEAESMFKDNIKEANSIEDVEKIMKDRNIAKVMFCARDRSAEFCADEIKDKTKGEVRGTKLDGKETPSGNCIVCGKPAKEIVYIARSY
jgi:prolyl-tRNA synthetase